MATRISVGAYTLLVDHHERAELDQSQRRDEAVLIVDSSTDPDTLTEINVIGPDLSVDVAVHWTDYHQPFQAMLIPETSVLFVGGGRVSAAVDLRSRKVVDQKHVCLFWAFELRPESVLEFGELESHLYSRGGHLLATVPVDPPYDVRDIDGGVEFTSEVMGTHVLRFPA